MTDILAAHPDIEFPCALSSFAARAAADELIANWRAALRDGAQLGDLVTDVEDVIDVLREWRGNLEKDLGIRDEDGGTPPAAQTSCQVSDRPSTSTAEHEGPRFQESSTFLELMSIVDSVFALKRHALCADSSDELSEKSAAFWSLAVNDLDNAISHLRLAAYCLE